MLLIEVFPNFTTQNNIFYYIKNGWEDCPWSDEDVTALTNGYYLNYSGQKEISPLLSFYANGQPLTANNIEKVANIIRSAYGKNFIKLYNTLNLEYSPIENYRMTEQETANENRNENGSNTISETSQGTTNELGTVDNNIYAFNSSSPVPSTDGGSETNTSSNAERTNTSNNEVVATGENTRNLTRSGNIGVTTSQQMIESEREVWLYDYYEIVYEFVDKVLTIPKYGIE